jgi:hypothetical protein
MRKLSNLLLTTAAALVLGLNVSQAQTQDDQNNGRQRQGRNRQGQGNFDPAQFQQRMMDRYRERLEITDDAEWKAIQPLVQNVVDSRMALGTGGRGAFGRGARRGGDGNSADTTQRRNPGQANPAADALRKAIDGKASATEIKAALTKYNAYRKEKQAELEKAQAALRAVLTSRQEAIASLSGLL